MTSRRALNPAFAAAHGLSASSNDGEDDNVISAEAGKKPTAGSSKRLELILKEARSTGKLQASNCGLKAPLPIELFDFRANIVVDLSMESSSKKASDGFVHGEETLTLVDLSDNALDGSLLDERILRYEQIQVLRLKRCGLVGSTVDLQSMEHLMLLDLEGNQLSEFRLELLPTTLQQLNLANNRLTNIRCESASMSFSELVSMDLSGNQLESLEESFKNVSLPKLKSLACHHNCFKSFSLDVLGISRASMQSLDISHNLLQGQQLNLSQCHYLQTVLLSFNRMTQIPCIPTSVSRLDLTTNRIESIQGMYSEKTSEESSLLVELLLQDNSLMDLDASVISKCTKLQRLDLSANKLRTLPYQLGFLVEIDHLSLTGNPLYTFKASEISDTKALLQKLRGRAPKSETDAMEETKRTILSSSSVLLHNKTIYLKGTGQPGQIDLEQLVKELNASPTLTFDITGQLVLDNQRLESLPETLLPILPNLTELSLRQNSFRILPPSLATACPRLTRLLVANNALTNIDNFFSNNNLAWSQTLTHLNLSSNRLSCISGSVIHQLPCLQVLDLSFNKLSSVEHWEWLPPTLTYLDLSENAIEQVHNLVLLLGSHCPQLEILRLQQNYIHRIPATLGLLQERCPNFKVLDLKGNPQHSIRPEILSKPTRDQLAYLMNRLTTEQKTAAQVQMDEWDQKGTKPIDGLPPSPVKVANQSDITTAPSITDAEEDEEEARIEALLSGFRTKIAEFECELDSSSLSQAKRYAIKKSLAMERSKLIREERKLGLRK